MNLHFLNPLFKIFKLCSWYFWNLFILLKDPCPDFKYFQDFSGKNYRQRLKTLYFMTSEDWSVNFIKCGLGMSQFGFPSFEN